MPDAGRTHGPPATKKAGGSHHRSSRYNRHSLRNGFNGCSALSPESGLVSLRHLAGSLPLRFDTSVGGVRTTRLCRPPRPTLVCAAPSVHRIPRPTSVTIAIRPSDGCRTGRNIRLICASEKAKYFYRRSLTRIRKISASGKSAGVPSPPVGEGGHRRPSAAVLQNADALHRLCEVRDG
jgi:hypothetical protein